MFSRVPRRILEWPYTAGGGGGLTPPHPWPPTKVTIVGKTEIYNWENLL